MLYYSGSNSLTFRGSLDEGFAGDLSFADALEAFGAGQDDPVSVAIGGYFIKALMFLLVNFVLVSHLYLANPLSLSLFNC